MGKIIWGISAHCDDIELGMGGTISRYINEGYDLHILICFPISDIRKIETYESLNILGVNRSNIYFCIDNSSMRAIVSYIDSVFSISNPNEVYTHFYGDTHQDHKIVCDATLAACRKYNSCQIFLWETTVPGGISYNTFYPNVFIKLTNNNIEKKIMAFKEHKSQLKKYDLGLIDFIEHKATTWGHYCGGNKAEVFSAIKCVI